MLAHIVGIPVEEVALAFAPVATLGFGGLLLVARRRLAGRQAPARRLRVQLKEAAR